MSSTPRHRLTFAIMLPERTITFCSGSCTVNRLQGPAFCCRSVTFISLKSIDRLLIAFCSKIRGKASRYAKSPADRAWKGGYVQWKSGSIRATRVSIFPERMSSFMADTSTRSS